MQLIAPLASGITAAPGGTAEIYARGTSTRATVYASFEADGADGSGEDIELDEDGAALVYVNQVVDVVVRDFTGTIKRRFTCGVGAASVEVISNSVTGTDYVTGATGAGKPTNLAAVINLFLATFGGTNFLIGGTSTLLSGYGQLSGVYYNVKSYGALGNGVANDTAAFTAAISAAQAAGGGTVFVPPGTYLLNSTITVSSLVSMQGAGASISRLILNAAGATVEARNVFQDLGVTATLNLSGGFVSAVATLSLRRCTIGHNSFTATSSVSTNNVVSLDECDISVAGATQSAVGESGGSLNMQMVNCRVYVYPATYSGQLFPADNIGQVAVVGSRFEFFSTNGGGRIFNIDSNGSAQNSWSVVGSTVVLTNSIGTPLTWFHFDATTTGAIAESGNQFLSAGPNDLVPFAAGTTNFATTGAKIGLSSRDKFARTYADDSAALTIDTLAYGLITVVRTNNTAQTVTFADAPVGSRLTVVYHNDHAAGGGVTTFANPAVDMVAAANQFTLAANTYRVFQFESRLIGANLRWVEVEMAAADEPE